MLLKCCVLKNFNKDMKNILHFSLQFKNIVLLLHRQKQTMGYGVMVTLQILVLSFLVRIQVAQLKRSSQEGRFFVCVWREMFVPNILLCWLGVIMRA